MKRCLHKIKTAFKTAQSEVKSKNCFEILAKTPTFEAVEMIQHQCEDVLTILCYPWFKSETELNNCLSYLIPIGIRLPKYYLREQKQVSIKLIWSLQTHNRLVYVCLLIELIDFTFANG